MRIEELIMSKNLEETKKAVLNILVTEKTLTEELKTILKKNKLSPEQYNVLRILRGQKGNPINMTDIQNRMIHKTSNTTRLVDKLILKNFVTRKACNNNKRKMEVLITAGGLEILKKLDPTIDDFDLKYAKNLSIEELTTLNNLLEKYRG